MFRSTRPRRIESNTAEPEEVISRNDSLQQQPPQVEQNIDANVQHAEEMERNQTPTSREHETSMECSQPASQKRERPHENDESGLRRSKRIRRETFKRQQQREAEHLERKRKRINHVYVVNGVVVDSVYHRY